MFDDYVGIPYRPLGYTRRGTFCYGLVRLVLAEQFDIHIGKHVDVMKEALRHPEREVVPAWEDDWTKLECWRSIRPGDVLRMNGFAPTTDGRQVLTRAHVGVCVENGLILHTELATGSIIEKTHSKRFEWRPIEGYRYHG